MTNHYTDVCEATIKSLRQQLADRDAEVAELKNNVTICVVRIEDLRQQLAEREAQIARLRGAMQQQNFWVEGALLCKEWQWCPDQRETAEGCLAYAKEALATTEPKEQDHE
jgi:chromosome segregation ATPase